MSRALFDHWEFCGKEPSNRHADFAGLSGGSARGIGLCLSDWDRVCVHCNLCRDPSGARLTCAALQLFECGRASDVRSGSVRENEIN